MVDSYFEMKFAGKDISSTEGVTLSGAVFVCRDIPSSYRGATANGSTLWRHLDKSQGPKGQHMCRSHRNLSGNRTEKTYCF